MRRQVAEHGGGPYGVGALGWFVVLEALDLYEVWLGTGALRPFLERLLSGIWGFGVDSIMNGVWAMIWPLEVFERFGAAGIVLVGVLLSVDAFEEELVGLEGDEDLGDLEVDEDLLEPEDEEEETRRGEP